MEESKTENGMEKSKKNNFCKTLSIMKQKIFFYTHSPKKKYIKFSKKSTFSKKLNETIFQKNDRKSSENICLHEA